MGLGVRGGGGVSRLLLLGLEHLHCLGRRAQLACLGLGLGVGVGLGLRLGLGIGLGIGSEIGLGLGPGFGRVQLADVEAAQLLDHLELVLQ